MSRSSLNGKLWIDGVGCYVLCCEETFTIGNAMPQGATSFKLGIVANLANEQIQIDHTDGSDWITPRHATHIDDTEVHERTCLRHGAQVRLGDDVRLRYTVPSSLSGSAVFSIESGHRFDGGVDGVILLRKICLLGGGTQQHIRCDDWKEQVIIFERESELYCKSTGGELIVDDVPVGQISKLSAGSHFQGEDWSMTFESIPHPVSKQSH